MAIESEECLVGDVWVVFGSGRRGGDHQVGHIEEVGLYHDGRDRVREGHGVVVETE
jgi:hypothetical protein